MDGTQDLRHRVPQEMNRVPSNDNRNIKPNHSGQGLPSDQLHVNTTSKNQNHVRETALSSSSSHKQLIDITQHHQSHGSNERSVERDLNVIVNSGVMACCAVAGFLLVYCSFIQLQFSSTALRQLWERLIRHLCIFDLAMTGTAIGSLFSKLSMPLALSSELSLQMPLLIGLSLHSHRSLVCFD